MKKKLAPSPRPREEITLNIFSDFDICKSMQKYNGSMLGHIYVHAYFDLICS